MAFDLHETTSPLIFAAFATIAAPIASLLNTLTILAVKQKKELRQRLSSVLLSSMAVADLLTGVIGIPLSAIVALCLPYRIVTVQHFCLMDLVTSILTFSLAICSLIHLTIIAWERYISIRKWTDYKTIVTRSRLRKMAISAWFIWGVAVSPVFIIMLIAVGQDETVLALVITIFATGSAGILVCILVLIVSFYIMIYLGVRKRNLNQILQVDVLVQAKLENRIALTTAFVTIALILSFVPTVIVGALGRVYPVLGTRIAWRISDSFLFLNSLVNPLIYCYRDRRFRSAVLELLRMRNEGVRFVKRKNSLVSVRLGIQTAENPFRLARSASCDLALFSLDRAYLKSMNTSLKRTMSEPSLLKDDSSANAKIYKVKTPVRLVRCTSCDLSLFRLDCTYLESYKAPPKRNKSAPSLPT